MRLSHPTARHRFTKVVASAAVLLTIAACGSTEDTTTDEATDPQAEVSLPAEAAQRLDSALEPVADFPGPTESISPPADVDITVITCSATGETCVRTADGATRAGEILGWDVTVVDGKGVPTEWNAAMSSALAGGTDAIILAAIPPALVGAGLEAAQEADVPVIYAHGLEAQGATALVAADRAEQGRVIADYIARDSGGDGQILLLRDPEFPELEAMAESFKEELETVCPDCSITDEPEFTLGAMTKDVPTIVQAAMQSDPDIDYVFGPYDVTSTFINQGVRAAAHDPVKVVATGGDGSSITSIESGDITATAGVPSEWIGFQSVDAIARALAGEAIPDTPVVSGLVVADNVSEQAPDGVYDGGFDYESAYKELWGK